MNDYRRSHFDTIRRRLREPRLYLQIIIGPRQVGKTTVARQVLRDLGAADAYCTADAVVQPGFEWIEHVWGLARRRTARDDSEQPGILVIDEIQKIPDWAEITKRLWDEDTHAGRKLQVVLLGSSPLLLGRGLTESLAGRFELIRMMHWSCGEMQTAFGWDLDTYLYHGGYPGSAPLINEPTRWAGYIRDALVSPTLEHDVYELRNIRKPALLRQVFDLAMEYPARILSYNKMLGRLDDAGNTTTLAEYVDILGTIGILAGLERYASSGMRRKRSTPKLVPYNTALSTAGRGGRFEEVRHDPVRWGRLVETAIGAHLLNAVAGTDLQLYYWRDRDMEVDYVLADSQRTLAIEVKSGHRIRTRSGLESFRKRFPAAGSLIVGGGGMNLDAFFRSSADDLL